MIRFRSPAFSPTVGKIINKADRRFILLLRALAGFVVLLLVALIAQVAFRSWPAIHAFGLKFFVTNAWNPVTETYGAAAFIFGTVVSSALALLIAAPVSVGVALFLSELAPRRLSAVIAFLVEMLAAIPSVVYGLWGIFVLAPWMRETVQPALGERLGFLPLFQGAPYGVGMLTAGLILAIMIMPTITAICREVFRAIPVVQREAALGLGATRWETIRISVLSASMSGILGALVLGLGRAIGETMAVTMVIGNRSDISASLFAPAQTMASVIANEYAEATTDEHLAALSAVGLALFLVSLCMNAGARWVVERVEKRLGGRR